MCMAIYVASDVELPTSKWDKDKPEFYAMVAGEDFGVRKQFSKKFVYYLGSDEGCGCGFWYDDNDIDDADDILDNEKGKNNVKRMVAYLQNALTMVVDLELFVSWEGEQGNTPLKRGMITPEELLCSALPVDKGEFYRVVRG